MAVLLYAMNAHSRPLGSYYFDRNMWQLNAVPSESESRAVLKLLEHQQGLISTIEKLQKESDAERQRLSCKATMLQETLNSLVSANGLSTEIQSNSIPLLEAFSEKVLDLEAKRDLLHPLFTGTTTLLDSFWAVNDAINHLKSTVETLLGQLQNFSATVAREFYSTEILSAQTTDAVTSFSDMVAIAQRSILFKQNGVLHPLRRVPEEILVQIFDLCADEEARGWLECFGSILPNPRALTRIGGVCRRWRSIVLSHPPLWCRLLAPVSNRYQNLDYRGIFTGWTTIVRGADHFRHMLQLCQGIKLELTIPTQFTCPPDIESTTLEVGRLNLLDASQTWPPPFPSPKHLWLGQAATNGALSREIPLSVISNTSQITSYNISLTFASPINTVTHLVLCGQHGTLPLNALLCSLPRLALLDAKDAHFPDRPGVNSVQSTTHSQLRTFGIDRTGLLFLEHALDEGLQLPNLDLFEIANVDSGHLATNYPSISTHISQYITHLGVLGTEGVAVDALRTFIDTFPRLETLSLHGAATEPALQALHRVPSSDGNNGCLKYSMPTTVHSVIICNYQGNGETVYQWLHEMYADPASDGGRIEISFQDCLNIRPDIRRKLSRRNFLSQLTG